MEDLEPLVADGFGALDELGERELRHARLESVLEALLAVGRRAVACWLQQCRGRGNLLRAWRENRLMGDPVGLRCVPIDGSPVGLLLRGVLNTLHKVADGNAVRGAIPIRMPIGGRGVVFSEVALGDADAELEHLLGRLPVTRRREQQPEQVPVPDLVRVRLDGSARLVNRRRNVLGRTGAGKGQCEVVVRGGSGVRADGSGKLFERLG